MSLNFLSLQLKQQFFIASAPEALWLLRT